jgi:small subunit ribosomal protein S17
MIAKTWVGTVVAKHSENTVMVSVSTSKRHPKYGKYIRKMHKYPAHDELNTSVGDSVQIREVPRISKTKSKRVIAVLDGINVLRKEGI